MLAENHHSDRERPWADRLGRRLRVPCLLLVLVVLAHWKLVLSNQFTWLDTPDIARQVLPWMQYQVGELQQGRLPLWDPFSWGGQPLLAQAQPGTANPVNWLLFAVPTRHGWIKVSALHWYFVLIHWAAALFFYCFMRSLGCQRAAAVIGGLIYTLGGFLNYVDWPQQKMGGLWTPLVFLYVFHALQGDRYWKSIGLAGAFLGLSVLTGHHVAPLFAGLAVAALWIWEIVVSDLQQRKRLAVGLVALGLVAGLVSAVQVLPSMEYSKLALRWVGMAEPVSHDQPVAYSVHSAYGIQSFALMGTILPGIHRHTNAFVGFLTVLFAILAVHGLWRDDNRGRATRWLTATAIGGLFFCLAGETNLHGMLYALVPMLEKARNPSHAVLLWSVGVAGLAALGIDRLLRREDLERTRRVFLWAAGGLALFMWGFWYAYYAVKEGKVEADSRGVVAGFLALVAMALVSGWAAGGLSRRALVAGLTTVVVAELGSGMAYQYPSWDSKWRAKAIDVLPTDSELVAFLQGQKGLGRFQWDLNQHPHNISDLYGVETDTSYLASVTANIYRLGPWGANGRRLMGVRYRMAAEPEGDWNRQVFTTPDGRKVWENDQVLPRVWTVHETQGGFTRGDVAREMQRGTHDFGKWAFLEGPAPQLATCGGPDAAYLLRRVSNRVEIWSEMACRGMVVLSDTWYPGWEAAVDGKPAELLEVYGALRGVVVEKGAHRITMTFRPWSVYLGALLTLAGLLVAWGLGRWGPRLDAALPPTEGPSPLSS